MKILMPFKVHDGKKITDNKVMGGLERFAQLLYYAFKDHPTITIVPYEITKETRESGRALIQMAGGANTDAGKLIQFGDEPSGAFDLILSNYEEETYTTRLIEATKLPVVWIYHTAYDGTFGRVKSIRLFKKFTDMDGHLYFVSEHQKRIYDVESVRLMEHPVEKIKGFVNPAHCTGDEFVSNKFNYDVSTIARTSYMKDPFYVHRQLDSVNSVHTSVVVTTGGHHLESGKEKKYYEENLKYNETTAPRTTFRDLPYIDGIKTMANTKVFISTWPLETWGITSLESLSHGVPTILLTDSTGTHASEGIAADSSHIRLIPKTAPAADLELAIAELTAYTPEKRQEIALATQAKHSKQAFIDMYTKVFNDAVAAKKSKI